MANLFDIKHSKLEDLKKFYKRAPRLFNKASAFTLNDQAFSARLTSIEQIEKTMTVRSKAFVKGSIQVTPTKITDINNLRTIYGSVERPRFTGWAEQEHGTTDNRNRTITKAARQGSFSKKVAPRARLSESNRPYTYRNFRGNNSQTKARATARMLRQIRDGEVKRKPFMIADGLKGKLRKLNRGLYEMKSKRLMKLQDFTERPSQPKRNKWMTASNSINAKRNPMDKLWERNLNKILPVKL